MKTEHFINQLDEARIVAAIGEAESRTSGEIRVFVSSQEVTDPVDHAIDHFHKFEMHQTRNRNAVLIFFAPRSQQFAVVGDKAIHEKCGDPFWKALTDSMREALQSERFSEAVVMAVERCGELLANHFPISPDDENELPNILGRD